MYQNNIFRNLVCTGLLLLTILSCSAEEERSDERKKEITFWHSFVASTIPALNDIINKYEAENPSIKINAQYVPTGDALVHKLITAIQSSTTPDIAWIHTDFLSRLVEAEAIYEMNHFINGKNGLSSEEFNDIFPALLNNAEWKDTLYAMPMEATTLALVYNKTMFKEAGIDPDSPPSNWSELAKYTERLTLDKNGDGKFDQYGFYVPVFPASGPLSIWMLLQWEPFLWQAGGKLIDEDQSKVLFNKKPGIDALELWKQLYDTMDFASFSLSHDMGFSSGTVAMVMDGPWNLPTYRKINKFEWGVTSLPAGPAGKATYLAGEHLAIFRDSDLPDEAWNFIKWFISTGIQAEFSIKSGYLPVRKSTLELESYKDYLKTDKYLAGFVDQIKIARARANLDFHKVEINQLVAEAVERSIMGNVSAKEALDESARKADMLLSKKKE